MNKILMIFFIALFFHLVIPFVAQAHEVYVLPSPEINIALNSISPNPFTSIPENALQFVTWALGIIIALLITLRISLWERLQMKMAPFIVGIKKYAPLIERFAVGSSLIASAYAHALFGPELPLTLISPSYSSALEIILYSIGTCIIFGLLTRLCGIILGIIFIIAMSSVGIYLTSYLNYFATAILLVLVGGGSIYSLDKVIRKRKVTDEEDSLHDFAFFLLRVFYGTGLIFAAFYAKLIHSNLALDTVIDYHLTNYFPFQPLFLVLGAFFVECVIAVFIILGFQLRLALIVFTVFLTSSIIFFGESVWPHIILFGLNLALFLHGYDKFTLLKRFSKNKLEPLL